MFGLWRRWSEYCWAEVLGGNTSSFAWERSHVISVNRCLSQERFTSPSAFLSIHTALLLPQPGFCVCGAVFISLTCLSILTLSRFLLCCSPTFCLPSWQQVSHLLCTFSLSAYGSRASPYTSSGKFRREVACLCPSRLQASSGWVSLGHCSLLLNLCFHVWTEMWLGRRHFSRPLKL